MRKKLFDSFICDSFGKYTRKQFSNMYLLNLYNWNEIVYNNGRLVVIVQYVTVYGYWRRASNRLGTRD